MVSGDIPKYSPSIWTGAIGPRMLGITGREADGWYPAGTYTPEAFAEKLKIILDAVFIGVIVDPLFVTPMAAISFGLVLSHYNKPMFSGKRAAASWINIIVSIIPILDMLPDWTAYALYLTFAERAANTLSTR